MKKLLSIALALLLCAPLAYSQGGGYPSRPRFQSVGINQPASATTIALGESQTPAQLSAGHTYSLGITDQSHSSYLCQNWVAGSCHSGDGQFDYDLLISNGSFLVNGSAVATAASVPKIAAAFISSSSTCTLVSSIVITACSGSVAGHSTLTFPSGFFTSTNNVYCTGNLYNGPAAYVISFIVNSTTSVDVYQENPGVGLVGGNIAILCTGK